MDEKSSCFEACSAIVAVSYPPSRIPWRRCDKAVFFAVPARMIPQLLEQLLTLSQSSESFDNVYLDLSKDNGNAGSPRAVWDGSPLGVATPSPSTRATSALRNGAGPPRATRSRSSRETLPSSSSTVFSRKDYERLVKIFKSWYNINLEVKEHALRGWNWGKAEFGKGRADLQRSKPARLRGPSLRDLEHQPGWSK